MSEEKKSIEKKLYELSFNIIPNSKEKAEGVFDRIKKTLEENHAEITKETKPQLINLAYTMIKKIQEKNCRFDQAYFGSVVFIATAESVENIKHEIDSDLEIIRFLIVKTVDDAEHSTNKILKEVKAGDISEQENVEPAEELTEVDELDSEETVDEVADDKKTAKIVDEAIEDLVN